MTVLKAFAITNKNGKITRDIWHPVFDISDNLEDLIDDVGTGQKIQTIKITFWDRAKRKKRKRK